MHFAVRLLLVAVLASAVRCAVAQDDQQKHEKETKIESRKEEMPKLFNFDFFKHSFGKTYASHVEELARKALFMARAFKAFVSGVAYSVRQSGHYLAVNFMSDQTPSERAAMKNKVMARSAADEAGRLARGGGRGKTSAEQAEEQVATVDPEPLVRQIEHDIEQVIEGGAGAEFADLLSDNKPEVGSEAVVGPRRRKRSAAEEPRKPRDMSFKLLVKLPNQAAEREPPEVSAKIKIRVPSSNPKYEHIEMPTQGLVDQQRPINKWKIDRPGAWSLYSAFKSTLGYFLDSVEIRPTAQQSHGDNVELETVPEEEDEQVDKIFFDHRKSGCLFTPRNQGKCGSCYAFATIAYIEWLHCVKTGDLVAFSEQYLIDCGHMRVNGNAMLGCDGAFLDVPPKFVHNFGVELRANYPYRARRDQCPYDDSTNLDTVGYIRMELGDIVDVPRERWHEYIEFSPLYVGLATPADFEEYAGGVDSGAGCTNSPDHTMLLVGHGREDGQDYWLIRNSYSPGWGDMGYYKLSKKAPKRCFDENRAIAFGSRDGKTYNVTPSKNALNDQSVVQKRYSYALYDEVL